MGQKLDFLEVFFDEQARTGPENMAVDELLLISVKEIPWLRFYQWSRPEVSFGYFDQFKQVQEKFDDPELHYVRRWTGGGVVDHRNDCTYTLVLPKDHAWTKLKGAESYRIIHEAVIRALKANDVEARLSQGERESDSIACFEHPVSYDVIDKDGNKLAGAGQKRSRQGLLHQGSVKGVPDHAHFCQCLLSELSHSYEVFQPDLTSLNSEKYKAEKWTLKR